MKKLFTVSLIAFAALANAADTGLSPEYLKIKIYRFAVSTSEYCTNPQVVFENAAPEYEDVLIGPTFGAGTLRNGTYKCVMLEMSDAIKFAPDQNSDSGACLMGQELTLNVCNGSEETKNIEGEVSNCTVGEDKVTLYLSTASVINLDPNSGEDAFRPTAADNLNRGINLGEALKVAGRTSGKFVVNGQGKVRDYLNWGQRECELMPPAFSISKK